jgi:hypothetical protein
LIRSVAVLPALLLASAAAAADGELAAGAGIDYSQGDYGTGAETKILSIPFMLRYDTDAWKLKLTVPYLRVTGPGNVIPGIGRNGRGRQAEETTESGIGDTTVSATYTAYYNAASQLGFDLTGKLKLPTADENRGLGTGSTDVSFQGDLYKTIDRLTVFGGLGYTRFGHSDVVELKNAFYYEVGASTLFTKTDSVGASLYGREAVVEGGSPQRELTFFWNRRVAKERRLQAYVLMGLADGSPDWGVGVSALFSF